MGSLILKGIAMIIDDIDRASKAYRFGKFLGRCV